MTSAVGAAAGALLGGVLTSALSWRWIFWINLPIGATVYALERIYPTRRNQTLKEGSLDVAGAVSLTAAITLLLLAVLAASNNGLQSPQVRYSCSGALLACVLFLVAESRAQAPVIPVKLFRYENLSVSLLIQGLWAVVYATWAFVAALYLQHVLGYGALETGLSFFPAVLLIGIFALGPSRRLIVRLGAKIPFGSGLLLVTVGLLLLTQAAPQTGFVRGVLPGMLLVGLGIGIAYNSFLLTALSGVGEGDHGVAAGAVTTAGVLTGAIGLGAAASLAAYRTSELESAGAVVSVAVSSGYHWAFGFAAAAAAAAGLIGVLFLKWK
jgi:MFS family permease